MSEDKPSPGVAKTSRVFLFALDWMLFMDYIRQDQEKEKSLFWQCMAATHISRWEKVKLIYLQVTFQLITMLLRLVMAAGPVLILVIFPLWVSDCPLVTNNPKHWQEFDRLRIYQGKNGKPPASHVAPDSGI